MPRRAVHFLALLLFPVLAHGEGTWSQLKLFMSADETAATLGRPMLRTRGRGFETWTYDNGAEALIYGSLVGWTAPGTAKVVDRSMDVWRADRSGTYFPTFLALLPKLPARSTVPPPPMGAGGANSRATWLPVAVYRNR